MISTSLYCFHQAASPALLVPATHCQSSHLPNIASTPVAARPAAMPPSSLTRLAAGLLPPPSRHRIHCCPLLIACPILLCPPESQPCRPPSPSTTTPIAGYLPVPSCHLSSSFLARSLELPTLPVVTPIGRRHWHCPKPPWSTVAPPLHCLPLIPSPLATVQSTVNPLWPLLPHSLSAMPSTIEMPVPLPSSPLPEGDAAMIVGQATPHHLLPLWHTHLCYGRHPHQPDLPLTPPMAMIPSYFSTAERPSHHLPPLRQWPCYPLSVQTAIIMLAILHRPYSPSSSATIAPSPLLATPCLAPPSERCHDPSPQSLSAREAHDQPHCCLPEPSSPCSKPS